MLGRPQAKRGYPPIDEWFCIVVDHKWAPARGFRMFEVARTPPAAPPSPTPNAVVQTAFYNRIVDLPKCGPRVQTLTSSLPPSSRLPFPSEQVSSEMVNGMVMAREWYCAAGRPADDSDDSDESDDSDDSDDWVG